MQIDGDADFEFHDDKLGFKRLRITSFTDSYGAISGTSPQTGYLSKYDGTSIGWLTTSNNIDAFNFSSTNFYLSVADTDSGWGENYTPSSDEIKAYFNGYVMYQDGGGLYTSGTKYFAKRYQGIGTKGYLATGVVVENGSGTNQTTCPTNKAYGEDTKHYQLYYELANPTTETIATITPITTVSGQKNTISVTSDLGSIKSATITFDWAPELSIQFQKLKYRNGMGCYKGCRNI